MSKSEASLGSPLPERLVYEFEELGLSPYEARVLVTLLRLGAANTAQLARQSGVPRTSTYQILEELNRKGLAQRVSVDGPAMWASAGREQVFERLDAAEEEKLRLHRARTARIKELMAEALPEAPSGVGPYVHVIQGAAHATQIYERLVGGAEAELLVCNRPPYSYASDSVNPVVLDAVQRGVAARVLYEALQWHSPQAASFRAAMAVYHEAGVAARLVPSLPLKLAIADRSSALLAMTDPVLPEVGFPVTLLVEHPGYATLQADAFEYLWDRGAPVPT
jgi:sugar-specific transcriptional regulator TrmB